MPRITNSMLVANYLNNTRRNLGNMSTLQNQLSSGSVIKRASDNPSTATRIMQLNSEIAANKQYNSNIKDMSNWLDTTDTALSEAGNVFSRIRELMVKAGNGSYSQDEINNIKDEVVQKVSQLGDILNSSYDGNYIFGGTKSNSKPVKANSDGSISYLDKDGNKLPCTATGAQITSGTQSVTSMCINGTDIMMQVTDTSTTPPTVTPKTVSTVDASNNPKNAATLKTDLETATWTGSGNDLYSSYTAVKQIGSSLKGEISTGVTVDYNQTASNILNFTDTNTGTKVNVSDVINSIVTDMSNPTAANLKDLTGAQLTNMDYITKNLLRCRSNVGALQNRMDSAQSTNEDQNYNMTNVLSEVGDVDYTQKTMEYSVAQTVYTASLQVSGKVLTKTLLDYI
ncbi:flagellar hook-associated protein FlgL [Clostridium saccharoperbutylacetonicum]